MADGAGSGGDRTVAGTIAAITVVAQDPSRRRGLRRLLRQEQYQVTAAPDTATALRRAPDRPYDAASVALTERDGLAAVVRMRGHCAAVIASAPAVSATGSGRRAARV